MSVKWVLLVQTVIRHLWCGAGDGAKHHRCLTLAAWASTLESGWWPSCTVICLIRKHGEPPPPSISGSATSALIICVHLSALCSCISLSRFWVVWPHLSGTRFKRLLFHLIVSYSGFCFRQIICVTRTHTMNQTMMDQKETGFITSLFPLQSTALNQSC